MLTAELNRALASNTVEYWLALLNRAGISSGPIMTIEKTFNHPQITTREMPLRLSYLVRGEIMTTGLGVKLSEIRATSRGRRWSVSIPPRPWRPRLQQ